MRQRNVWGSIYKMITVKCYEQQEEENYGTIKNPKICIIGNTCFKSVAFIGGRLFSNSPKNNNHVHKNEKYLFSAIITLGGNVIGGDIILIMELESITWD